MIINNVLKNMQNKKRWIGLAVLLIGFFMIMLDTTIVNVSIPTIINDLKADLTQIEWIISGYALSFAALLITFGRLGDLYGRKKMFMLGLVVFTVASALSGEANSPTMLILARILQGVGGAMLSPATLSIISSTFKDKERAMAFGAFGAISGAAAAVGPILGGWLTTYQDWRWIFRVNIPVGIIALILSYLYVTESKSEKKEKIDFSGMITSGLGFFFLVFGLIEGQNYGWLKPAKDFVVGNFIWGKEQTISIILISFILSLLFLVIFIYIQFKKTKKDLSPAVNTTFFKSKAFRYGLVAVAIIALGEFSSLFTLPIFFQSIRGFSPLQSGYALLPLALAAMIAAPISAFIVNKIGSKKVITIGISMEALGLFLLSFINADTTYVSLIPALFFLGFGLGLAIAQNTQVILSEIDPINSGSASGVLNTIRQVGTALGIAVIGAIMVHQAAFNIPQQIKAADLPAIADAAKNQIADAIGSNNNSYTGSSQDMQKYLPTPPAEIMSNPILKQKYEEQIKQTQTNIVRAVNVGLAKSIANAIRYGSIFMVLGALCSLLIPNKILAKKD